MDGILKSLAPAPLNSLNSHLLLGLSTYMESFHKKSAMWDGSAEFCSWRNHEMVNGSIRLSAGEDKASVQVKSTGHSYSYVANESGNTSKVASVVSVSQSRNAFSDQNVQCSVFEAKVELEGKLQTGTVAIQTPLDGLVTRIDVWLDGQTGTQTSHYQFSIQSPLHGAVAQAGAVNPVILSPMPGKIVKVNVADGGRVKKGEPILILEAMKMEHVVSAPCDGYVLSVLSLRYSPHTKFLFYRVVEIFCAPGNPVNEGSKLAEVKN